MSNVVEVVAQPWATRRLSSNHHLGRAVNGRSQGEGAVEFGRHPRRKQEGNTIFTRVLEILGASGLSSSSHKSDSGSVSQRHGWEQTLQWDVVRCAATYRATLQRALTP